MASDDNASFKEIAIDAAQICDWPTFHTAFATALGFPEFYGSNMNAWIDCMTSLDDPGAGMSKLHAPRNGIVLVKILNAKAFAARCPEQYSTLNECAAFVNWRRREQGGTPVLALSYYG